MPSVAENKATWSDPVEWLESGNEWSAPYGTPAMQWYGSLLPRIHLFVPTATILEIAPGMGRWTQYLKELCQRLIVVDLSAHCIEVCQKRFAASRNIEYHVNDGESLAMIEDGSIDFLFTFDSLVHVESEVMGKYLAQLGAKLAPNGVAFIHHSNLASYGAYFSFLRILRGRRYLARLGIVEPTDHWRARTMSADVFSALAAKEGLKVIGQELINWPSCIERLPQGVKVGRNMTTKRPIDCISMLTRPGSKWARDSRRLVNAHFGREAFHIGRLAPLYDATSFGA